jgi:hypothetical protein
MLDAGRYYRLPSAVIMVNSIGVALRGKLLELMVRNAGLARDGLQQISTPA